MAETPANGRPWLSSVRFRVAATALVVVGFAFAIGGATIVWQLHRSANGTVADLTVS